MHERSRLLLRGLGIYISSPRKCRSRRVWRVVYVVLCSYVWYKAVLPEDIVSEMPTVSFGILSNRRCNSADLTDMQSGYFFRHIFFICGTSYFQVWQIWYKRKQIYRKAFAVAISTFAMYIIRILNAVLSQKGLCVIILSLNFYITL